MAPNINNPGGDKNEPAEIRNAVVSDATRFPGGFINEQITEAGAPVQIVGRFNLQNASFAQPFDVSTEDSTPAGLAFSPDGSRLYIPGKSDSDINQYSLSTAFDISTESFDQSFDVSPQDVGPNGVDIKPDGSQLYVMGRQNENVYQYSLSTAFDISTASFDQSFDVRPQGTTPQDLSFRPDGSQLFTVESSNEDVHQYSLSTAFDISTASFDQSFSVSSQDATPTGVDIRPDGTQMYVSGSFNANVYQYSLSTAFDISTASFDQSLDVSPRQPGPTGLVFKPDGGHLYVVGSSNLTVDQYAVGLIGTELE